MLDLEETRLDSDRQPERALTERGVAKLVVMPRSNRPRGRRPGDADDEIDLSRALMVALHRDEADGVWNVQPLAAASATKYYVCPGAASRSRPGSRTPSRGARTASWVRPTTLPTDGTGTCTAGGSSRERHRNPRRSRAARAPGRHRAAHARTGSRSSASLRCRWLRKPVATLVCLHPLPTGGGFMDSHILRKAAARLPALADIAVLRFNFRGVTSPRGTRGSIRRRHARGDGPRRGHGPRHPARTPASVARRLVVRHGGRAAATDCSFRSTAPSCSRRRSSGQRMPNSPRGRAAASGWSPSSPSWTITCGRPKRASGSRVVPEADLVEVEGGKHLWVGEHQTARVLNEIVAAGESRRTHRCPPTWDDCAPRGTAAT